MHIRRKKGRVYVHIRRKVKENSTHCLATRSVRNSDYTGEILQGRSVEKRPASHEIELELYEM